METECDSNISIIFWQFASHLVMNLVKIDSALPLTATDNAKKDTVDENERRIGLNGTHCYKAY